MSLVSEHTAIGGKFQAEFINVDGSEFLPTQYPNKPRPDTKSIMAWARMTILNGQVKPHAVGGKETRSYNIFSLEIFIRENEGTRPARLAREKIKTIFQNQRIVIEDGDILFGSVEFKTLPAEAGWSKHNVSVVFHRDERDP